MTSLENLGYAKKQLESATAIFEATLRAYHKELEDGPVPKEAPSAVLTAFDTDSTMQESAFKTVLQYFARVIGADPLRIILFGHYGQAGVNAEMPLSEHIQPYQRASAVELMVKAADELKKQETAKAAMDAQAVLPAKSAPAKTYIREADFAEMFRLLSTLIAADKLNTVLYSRFRARQPFNRTIQPEDRFAALLVLAKCAADRAWDHERVAAHAGRLIASIVRPKPVDPAHDPNEADVDLSD